MDAKKLVLNQSVLNWLYRPIHGTQDAENAWGRALMGKKAWSGAFGEQLVQEYFESLGIPIKRLTRGGPDFETEKFFIEVKTGSWKTTGTAHEKIAGVPHKYTDYLQTKKLIIITIGRAEHESKKLFNREFVKSEYVRANQFLFLPFSELIRSSFTIDDGSFE